MTIETFCKRILLTIVCGYTGFIVNPVWTPLGMLIGLILGFIIF